MPKLILESGIASVKARVVIINLSTGAEILTFDNTTTGLEISMIADNEASWTDYTVAAGNVETITTIGTFAAPSSGKVRFKHVGKGLYEIQAADARWNVSGARAVQIKISGAAAMGSVWAEIQQTPVPANVLQAKGSDVGDAYVRAIKTIALGTVGGGSTTTSIVTSAMTPAGAGVNQFKDRALIFANDTATAALRGTACLISASTNATNPVLTVSALPVAPASGDTFTIA